MKINLLIFLFFMLAIECQVKGQNINEKEIIGKWNVRNVNITNDNIPQESKAPLSLLKSAFLKSKFDFKEDKNFTFYIDINEMQIERAHWKFDSSTNTIVIQEWKDKDTNEWPLMQINVGKKGDKTVFTISESFLELEMVEAAPLSK